MLNVIDISGWQKGLDLATMFAQNPTLGGVVIKITGGVCIDQSSTFRPWADWCIANGKPFGAYHFLDDDYKSSSGKAEAEFFVSKVKSYVGKCLLVADYEAQARQLGTGYLKDFLDRVYELTGVKPLVYCSQSVANQSNMNAIAAAGYPLWVAQYANYSAVYSFNQNPWKNGSVSPWKQEVMRQYTSQLYLPGWRSNLDADLFYGDRDDWYKLCGVNSSPTVPKKSLDDIARDVINGVYGNGKARVTAIANANLPYTYDEIQSRVNEILSAPKKTSSDIHQAALDCIAGKYGNGVLRTIRLRLAGFSNPQLVQDEVNRILLGR